MMFVAMTGMVTSTPRGIPNSAIAIFTARHWIGRGDRESGFQLTRTGPRLPGARLVRLPAQIGNRFFASRNLSTWPNLFETLPAANSAVKRRRYSAKASRLYSRKAMSRTAIRLRAATGYGDWYSLKSGL